MVQIPLTNNYIQNFTYTVPEVGKSVAFRLFFNTNSSNWYLDINYNQGQFILNGKRVDTSPNLLNAFRNILPFGIAIFGKEAIKPFRLASWILEDAQFFIATPQELQEILD
jgi:hypothetical protein